MSLILKNNMGYILIFLLTAAFLLWNKGANDVRIERISTLETKVTDQTKLIEGYKKSISELEKYKFVEEGLKKIINEQRTLYSELEKENAVIKKKLMDDIAGMTVEESSSGSSIIKVWEFYKGTNK